MGGVGGGGVVLRPRGEVCRGRGFFRIGEVSGGGWCGRSFDCGPSCDGCVTLGFAPLCALWRGSGAVDVGEVLLKLRGAVFRRRGVFRTRVVSGGVW